MTEPGPKPGADSWKIRGGIWKLSGTAVMGVLNLTPDSFSDGGLFEQIDKAVERAHRMASEGADILDLGAESTRPGAKPVSAEEEIQRVVPVLRELKKGKLPRISIDTTKPEVARACLDEGADIINDVSGLRDSGSEMARLVRDSGAGLILMHRRGTPETMQSMTDYGDVAAQTLAELRGSFEKALCEGVRPEQLAVDPGLGFAKTAEQSLELLASIEVFHAFARPVVVGPSRKSFIGKVTGRVPSERDFGTAAAAAYAVLKGIQIIRVHAVEPMKDVVRVIQAIQGACHVRS
ncbi:MAG: dihydropteroate synthase [Candidatus Omnitrophica bacterium]|nr:dihydropteroate synthase [Candidatus Omnitrophota bacterium]